MKKILLLTIVFGFIMPVMVNAEETEEPFMSCTYELMGNVKYTFTYDCKEIKDSCSSFCSAKSNLTEQNLIKNDGTFQCPSVLYYSVIYASREGEINEFTISSTSNRVQDEEATLISDESNVDTGRMCETKIEEGEDGETEAKIYDFTCEYSGFFLKFNEGDTEAIIQPKPNLSSYKFQDSVPLNGNKSCPSNTCLVCAEGICAVNVSDNCAAGTDSPLVTDDVNNADDLQNMLENNATDENWDQEIICEDIFDTSDEGSVGWILMTILNYIRVIGPIAVVLLSSLDFIKAIMSSDEKAMKQAQSKLIIRLVAALALFLIPTLVGLLLDFINATNCADTLG